MSFDRLKQRESLHVRSKKVSPTSLEDSQGIIDFLTNNLNQILIYVKKLYNFIRIIHLKLTYIFFISPGVSEITEIIDT